MHTFLPVSTTKSLQETNPHGDISFPVDIHQDYFPPSQKEHYFFATHWHKEVELLLVDQGAFHLQIGTTELVLHEGEAIFINANQLHSGHSESEQDTYLHSLIFHPSFLYGTISSRIWTSYVQPLIENLHFPYFHIKPEDEEQKQLLWFLECSYRTRLAHQDGWELRILSYLSILWEKLWVISNRQENLISISKKASRDRQNIRSLLNYIHLHYTEKLTLKMLSSAAALSPGECGRLCKRVLHQTPVDYLLSYRIEQSIPDLIAQELTITEIALKVGFNSSSYYAEIFHRFKGVSPREFRKKILEFTPQDPPADDPHLQPK